MVPISHSFYLFPFRRYHQAWNPEGFCGKHKGVKEDFNPSEVIPNEIGNYQLSLVSCTCFIFYRTSLLRLLRFPEFILQQFAPSKQRYEGYST